MFSMLISLGVHGLCSRTLAGAEYSGMSAAPPLSTAPAAPWRTGAFPEAVPLVAQLSGDEIAYLHWLASRGGDPDSVMIDLGARAGGSAFALANGSAGLGERAPDIYSYDSFVATELEVAAGLFRLESGASTLGVYRANLSRFTGRVHPRAMMVPEFAGGHELAGVYPERAPVSVLFIDCAKAWGVHHTILGAFGPCLRPGSVVVQQDFRGPLVYLGLHMYQLRDRLRPVHCVDGGSVGFECFGPITGRDLDGLWRPEDLRGIGLDDRLVEASAYFDGVSPEPLSPWLWLSASFFCAQTDRPDDAVRVLEQAWSGLPAVMRHAPEERRRRVLASAWSLAAEKASRQLVHRGYHAQGAAVLGMRAWNGPDRTDGPGDGTDDSLRMALWRQVAARCAEIGEGRVALYGGGMHTDRLLRSGVFGGAARVVAIIDDAPERRGTIDGIPVSPPGEAPVFDVVIPSSDAHEEILLERSRAVAAMRGVPAFPVYSVHS